MKNNLARIACLILALSLILCAVPASGETTEETLVRSVLPEATSLKKQSLKSKYVTFEALGVPGTVLAVWKAGAGYVFLAEVHYGTEFYEDPMLKVYVGIDKQGLITGVALGETVDHTPSFLGMVTQEYLNETYVGQTASSTLTVDAVTGATFSSDAILYGVQTACYYAANVYRLGEREVQDIQLKKLAAVVPGEYEKLEVDPSFACEQGRVLYAARGTDAEGRAFHAVIAEAAFTPSDPNNNMAMPVYQIWFLDGDHTVFMANMLSGHFYEAFPMDADKLAAYFGMPLETGAEFDSFAGGLITDADEYVLTSATKAFPDTATGATVDGNDTSLSVRNCFITAARYYAQCIK